MKITIVGMGHVGTTLAYTLLLDDAVDEMVLVNRTHIKAVGEAEDLAHTAVFLDHPLRVRAGGVAESARSDIVVLTHSVRPDKPERRHLIKGNAKLFADTVPDLARASPNAVFVVISNPVEALTYRTIRLTGFPPRRVVGTGTLVDSARFRTHLSRHYGVHPEDIRAYILGEHGDLQFAALSSATYGGIKINPDDLPADLVEETAKSGMDVFQKKGGYTNFAISQAAALIVRSIARDQKRTMPVTTLIDNYAGVSDVCLSVPCVIGAGGVEQVLRPELSDAEQSAFCECADAVRGTLDECDG